MTHAGADERKEDRRTRGMRKLEKGIRTRIKC